MNESYGGALMGQQNAYAGATMARTPSVRERIALAVKQADERLAAVKRAQELFDKNPDLEELLNIMQSAHF